jgi:hypothetical protein
MRFLMDLRPSGVRQRLIAIAVATTIALGLAADSARAQNPPGSGPKITPSGQAPAPAGPGGPTAAQGKAAAPPPPSPAPSSAAAVKQPPPKQPPPKQPPPKQPAVKQPPPKQLAEKPKVYDELPVTDLSKDFARVRQVNDIIRSGNVPSGQQQAFEEFFKTYALARWANAEQSSDYRDLRKFRQELHRQLSNAARPGNGTTPAHQQLNALVLDFMSKLANNEDPATGDQKKFHPAVRYNAMLTIAELNQRESSVATDVPVALPAALPVLLQAVKDPNQHDAVRFAALLGIARHATLGIADPTPVIPVVRDLAKVKAEAGRSPEGHQWMRARAADALGAIRSVGQQNEVASVLAEMVADQGGHLLPRRHAAWALGLLNYPPNSGLDPSQLAAGLGQLAIDACEAELKHIEQEMKEEEQAKRRKTRPGGMPVYSGGYSGGGPGEVPQEFGPERDADEAAYRAAMESGGRSPRGARKQEEEEEEDDTLVNRRRLGDSLNTVVFGLTGMSWRNWTDWRRQNPDAALPGGVGSLATAPADQPFVKSIEQHLGSLLDLCAAKGKAEILGVPEDEVPVEMTQLSDKEVFKERLEELLAQLRKALTNVPAPVGPEKPVAGS